MKIIPSDNLADFFAADSPAREEADSNVQAFQASLQAGDCFLQYLPDADLVIWGQVLEVSPKDVPLYAEEHMKNYRSTRCYSQACPEGEFGDIRISAVASIIGRSQFEAGRERGWPSDIEALTEILRTAVDRN